jgi:hypothetical protein
MSKVSNISAARIEATAPKSPLVSRDPNRVEYATDKKGRRIGARQLSAIDMFELTLLLGEHSGNQAALNQAMMAASVVEIDDRVVARPTSFNELKARIATLDFAGYIAASEAVGRFAEPVEDNVDAIKN